MATWKPQSQYIVCRQHHGKKNLSGRKLARENSSINLILDLLFKASSVGKAKGFRLRLLVKAKGFLPYTGLSDSILVMKAEDERFKAGICGTSLVG